MGDINKLSYRRSVKILLVISWLVLFFLIPSFVLAQDDTCGRSGIWCSEEPVSENQEVRVYGTVQNMSGHDLTGVVGIFDGEELVGQQEFSVMKDGYIDVWADWIATAGIHDMAVRIIELDNYEIESLPQSLEGVHDTFVEEEIFVDLDNDGDGTGNLIDNDDDNDGLDDEQEEEIGTDPFNHNLSQEINGFQHVL